MGVANSAGSTALTANNIAASAKSVANTAKTTADDAKTVANGAETTANNAQSTANTAKTAADNAKTTAESIKPDWGETTSSSPKYIANRPCYIDKQETRSYSSIRGSSVLYGDSDIYWAGDFLSGGPTLSKNKIYRFWDDETLYAADEYRTSGYKYYDVLGNAALVASYLELVDDGLGNPVPDTGEDWAYVTKRDSGKSSMFSTTKNYKSGVYLVVVEETVKQLDERMIPPTIQRVGNDVIIPSSTADSTKRFKITVDDSGTLSATEVT